MNCEACGLQPATLIVGHCADAVHPLTGARVCQQCADNIFIPSEFEVS